MNWLKKACEQTPLKQEQPEGAETKWEDVKNPWQPIKKKKLEKKAAMPGVPATFLYIEATGQLAVSPDVATKELIADLNVQFPEITTQMDDATKSLMINSTPETLADLETFLTNHGITKANVEA